MQQDSAARMVRTYVLEYAVTPTASRQIDRCAVKFPMGQDRIAEQQNEEERVTQTRRNYSSACERFHLLLQKPSILFHQNHQNSINITSNSGYYSTVREQNYKIMTILV